ncbi:MAG: 3-deoxy-manno-octulosonate cytidylyltransferase [Planctomycetota bacterium]
MRATTAVAIIPVRLGSERLPGKALLADSGKPLFLHTWERAQAASEFSAVYIATDSDEVTQAAEQAGAQVLATSSSPRTGSERCAEAMQALDAELAVDIQGDWPEIDPGDLDRMVECLRSGEASCVTLASPLRDAEKAADPNVVKLVCDRHSSAMYFSRSAIPHLRADAEYERLRHIGVYGFDRQTLLSIPELPSSGLAEAEGLEQLRFLENGIGMQVLMAQGEPWGIESPADYAAFLARMRGAEAKP